MSQSAKVEGAERIENYINRQQIGFGKEQSAASEKQPQPDAVVRRLFAKMALIYGQKWISMYRDEDVQVEAERLWASGLSGIDLGRIKGALERCPDEYPSWPPTLGEFIEMCKLSAADVGLPTLQQAWAEIAAEHGQYSHGAVLAMRRDPRCHWWDWRLLPAQQAERRFEPIYHDYLRRVQAGEQFHLPDMVEDASEQLPSWEARKAYAKIHITAMREALSQ